MNGNAKRAVLAAITTIAGIESVKDFGSTISKSISGAFFSKSSFNLNISTVIKYPISF
jgi:hypothetical protein